MKKSYILLVCAVVVAVVVWAVERPDRSKVENFTSFLLCPDIAEGDVSMIEIKHLLSGSRITKTGDGWMVAGLETDLQKQLEKKEIGNNDKVGKKGKPEGAPPVFPKYRADTEQVARTIDEISNLEARAVVSTNPEKQPTYQVGRLAKEVTLYNASGDRLVDLYIGKNGPEMFTTYVRRGGEEEVYLVGGNIGAIVPAEVMSWRDREIWSVDPGFIVGVRVRRNKREYTISKGDDSVWQLAGQEETALDAAEANKFVDKIATITAARFAHSEDRDAAGFDKPGLELEVMTSDGKARNLIIGSADKQGYLYARLKDNGGEIYLLDSNFASLLPDKW